MKKQPFGSNFSFRDLGNIELGGFTGNVVRWTEAGTQVLAINEDGAIAIGNFTPGTFNIEIRDAGDANIRIRSTGGASSDAQLSLVSAAGNCQIDMGDNADPDAGQIIYNQVDEMIFVAGATQVMEIVSTAVRPVADNAVPLGGASNRWTEVFAATGTINTSDARDKAGIEFTDLGLDFVMAMQPRAYRFKGRRRTHYGFVAQEVAEGLEKLGVPTDRFAGFIRDLRSVETIDRDTNEVRTAEVETLGIRPSEFIGPAYAAIQELAGRVAALEAGKKR